MGVVPACADWPVTALLDVQLEVGVRCCRSGARGGAGVADASELVAEPGAVVGRPHVECRFHSHATHVHQTAQHVGLETSTFLVGEVRHADRVHGGDAVLLERLDHLQPAEHTQVAVEPATGAHRVDVRAHHHRGRLRVGTRPGAHHVADGVDDDGEAEVVHPAQHEVAPFAIGVGERQPSTPSLAGSTVHCPHLAQRLQARPQAIAVDAQSGVAHVPATGRPKLKVEISRSASPNPRTAPSNSWRPSSAVAAVGSPM